MNERKKKSRRSLVGPRTRQDMYVLAGLPISNIKQVSDFLKEKTLGSIVHAIPANSHDGALYGQSQIEALLRTVGGFAVRRRTNGCDQPVTPASITLLYVPSVDQENLLQAFDFSVLAIPLLGLAAYSDYGRQLRHDRMEVERVIAEATAPGAAMHAARAIIGWRIGRHLRSDDGLLLPPKNFLLGDGDLAGIFGQLRSGARAWDDRLTDFGPNELSHDDLPKRVENGRTLRVFVDARGMAFPTAHPAAFDGAPRELEADADSHEIAISLRALYRFGGALPRGFHHDAQRSDGSPLGGATFHCAEKGELSANGGYANVFPNDFVLPRE